MKGIILAGGQGNRLKPCTEVNNKHLLHVYNKPMIFYPLETLLKAGIKEILVISGPHHAGSFLKLLGEGEKLGCHLYFKIQEKAEGIAHAVGLTKNFVGNDNFAVVLGDNIYEDDVSVQIKSFKGKKGAHIFLKELDDSNRFGVAELKGDKVIGIEEKPKQPKSNYAVTGLYLYDNQAFDIIAGLTPSNRGEYEITDVNNAYIEKGQLTATILEKRWTDAGTFESLFRANAIARDIYIDDNYNGRKHQELKEKLPKYSDNPIPAN